MQNDKTLKVVTSKGPSEFRSALTKAHSVSTTKDTPGMNFWPDTTFKIINYLRLQCPSNLTAHHRSSDPFTPLQKTTSLLCECKDAEYKINLHEIGRIFNYTERQKDSVKAHWSWICNTAIWNYPFQLTRLLSKMLQPVFSQVPFVGIIRSVCRIWILSIPLNHLMPNIFWLWTALALQAFVLFFLMTDFIMRQGQVLPKKKISREPPWPNRGIY